ncbi:porin [Phyllobacterium endophyticum]|uniref:porin n=1 Tax=Phyllobacterium endophyticum TaxID=1149773 RepID=UPI0011C72725|nr:porin [Phyllobacterium endophyticum]TXR46998.1 porin [Phyllobacterium endophyticum]
MNAKGIVFVAVFAWTTGASAADTTLAKPEPIDYVRACDAYGAGFFYIPGTDTCLKVGGYLRYDAAAGDNVYTGGNLGGANETWSKLTRAEIRFDARSETELGTLRSYIDGRFQYTDGGDDGATLHQAYLELFGFQIGVNDAILGSWLDYAGDIVNDDVIQYGSDSFSSNEISYTYKDANGFSAVIAAEQGSEEGGYDYTIDDYLPHLLFGVKYDQDWVKISGLVGYDSVQEAIGAKARLDVNFSDEISAWVMGGYQSDYDTDSFETNTDKNWYGLWEGDWAAWGGFAVKVTNKATVNGQAAYESEGTYALALNVSYEIVPGFSVIPELNYTRFEGARKDSSLLQGGGGDAFGGIVRIQRNF